MEHGYLRVEAPLDGSYEIYRIASETPLQLVSEEVGTFNKDIPLLSGSYLILSDCSSANVVINPSMTRRLVAHAVKFMAPSAPQADDSFLIQCTRYEKTETRQRLINRYTLTMLSGKRELLVGMVPLAIDLDAHAKKPTEQVYDLAGILVANDDTIVDSVRFFVSPTRDLMSVTESQNLGQWLFLLPGDYGVELNGTQLPIKLAAKDRLIIEPAFLRVSTSPEVDLDASSVITGNPMYVEINAGHWLNLNETYPVLPGPVRLRLVGSERVHEIQLAPKESIEKHARSVQIDLDCPPWDWNCLGSKQVYLFEKDSHYPFASGFTDVPLLFFEEEAWVSLEGSRNLRYHLQAKSRDTLLKSGVVKLKPVHEVHAGLITDLARIEAAGAPFEGNTLDLNLEDESALPLIVGSYYFAQHVSSTIVDGERRRNRRPVVIKANGTLEIEFTATISEKKFQQLKDERIARESRDEKRHRARYSRAYQRAIPLRYQ